MTERDGVPERIGKTLGELDIDFGSLTAAGWAASAVSFVAGGWTAYSPSPDTDANDLVAFDFTEPCASRADLRQRLFHIFLELPARSEFRLPPLGRPFRHLSPVRLALRTKGGFDRLFQLCVKFFKV